MSLNVLLERTGLTIYQQKIFLYLFNTREGTAKEISNNTNIPMGRIYTEIDSLLKLGLLSYVASRPKKYVLDNPRSKIINLIELEREKLEEVEKDALEELDKTRKSSEVYHKLNEIRQSQIDSFRWSKEEICQCLGFIHMPSENRDIKSVYEKEIISAVERGVKFKALYMKGEKPPKSLIELSKENSELFKIRFSELPIPRFDIVDSRQILFKIQDPQDTSITVGTIIINNAFLARKLKAKFLSIWNESDGLEP